MNMFDRDRRGIDDFLKERYADFLREKADEIARKNGYTQEELMAMHETISKIKDRKHFTALIASLISAWHLSHHEQDKIFESVARISALIIADKGDG